MRTSLGFALFTVAVAASILLQEAFSPFSYGGGARVVLVPMIFCYGAAMLPFFAMVPAAVLTGLLCDLLYLHVVEGKAEIAVGWSILFFLLAGCLAQGIRPSVERGHWWPIIPVSMVTTFLYLALQFAMISMRRDSLVFSSAFFPRTLAPALLAGVLVPAIHLVLHPLRKMFAPEEDSLGRF